MSAAPGPTTGAQQGMVLVIVLWMLVLMTVIAATIATTQKAQVRLTSSQVSRTEGRALALAGIHYAVTRLADSDRELAWLADGVTRTWRYREQPIDITVTEESGRVDINAADRLLLIRLLAAIGLDSSRQQQLAGAIIDWRDPDGNSLPGGAEDVAYQQAGLDYGAKDDRFDDVSELRLVMGMDPTVYNRLRPAVTVDTGRAAPDPAYATPLVRAALAGEVWETGGTAAPQIGNRDGSGAGSAASADGFLLGVVRIRCRLTLPNGEEYSAEAVVSADRQAKSGISIGRWRENVHSEETGE